MPAPSPSSVGSSPWTRSRLGREGERMGSPLGDLVGRWVASIGIDPALAPTPAVIEAHFADYSDPCRPGADPRQIRAWEDRHGFQLPGALRAWLRLSNGFYLNG